MSSVPLRANCRTSQLQSNAATRLACQEEIARARHDGVGSLPRRQSSGTFGQEPPVGRLRVQVGWSSAGQCPNRPTVADRSKFELKQPIVDGKSATPPAHVRISVPDDGHPEREISLEPDIRATIRITDRGRLAARTAVSRRGCPNGCLVQRSRESHRDHHRSQNSPPHLTTPAELLFRTVRRAPDPGSADEKHKCPPSRLGGVQEAADDCVGRKDRWRATAVMAAMSPVEK